MDVCSGPSNKADIFLGLIEYELNSLYYISLHIRFDLERYLLIRSLKIRCYTSVFHVMRFVAL